MENWNPDPTVVGTLASRPLFGGGEEPGALVLEYTWAGAYQVRAGDMLAWTSQPFLALNTGAAHAALTAAKKALDAFWWHGLRPCRPHALRALGVS